MSDKNNASDRMRESCVSVAAKFRKLVANVPQVGALGLAALATRGRGARAAERASQRRRSATTRRDDTQCSAIESCDAISAIVLFKFQYIQKINRAWQLTSHFPTRYVAADWI